MYTQKPVIWFDTNRLDQQVVREYWSRPEWSALIPLLPGDAPIGTVTPRYPTPDELFRWSPVTRASFLSGWLDSE
jgi:hypothetical protein